MPLEIPSTGWCGAWGMRHEVSHFFFVDTIYIFMNHKVSCIIRHKIKCWWPGPASYQVCRSLLWKFGSLALLTLTWHMLPFSPSSAHIITYALATDFCIFFMAPIICNTLDPDTIHTTIYAASLWMETFMILPSQYRLWSMEIGEPVGKEQTVEQEYQIYVAQPLTVKNVKILNHWKVDNLSMAF